MKFNDIPKNDINQIDHFAWQAIKNWPTAAGFDPVYEGLNFGELVRWSLWSRVGRAIRSNLDPKGFRFEKDLLFHFDHHRPSKHNSAFSRFMQRLKTSLLCSPLENNSSNTNPAKGNQENIFDGTACVGDPLIFIPHPTSRLENIAAALMSRGYPIIVSPTTQLTGYVGAYRCPDVTRVTYDGKFKERLFSAIIAGLKKQGIRLLPFDQQGLCNQLKAQFEMIGRASAEIDCVAPSALLLHGDNHFPYQEYAAVAKSRGIPTITFQHGLDCEHFYLDDAYASDIAVWSMQRKERYEKNSERQPNRIEVTGNPHFDHITDLPERIDLQGNYLLWITRPHTSSYCYSPSRLVTEGLDIFDTLLDAVTKTPEWSLVVKPHPQDYGFLYESRITERNLTDRVSVATGDLQALISKATIVISEDSTGGLEAMLQGKILVHSYFAKSTPVLPFCQYSAALPGFSKEMLMQSLIKAGKLSISELDEMLSGQKNFIKDFAGNLDNMAEDRLISFCESVIEQNRFAGNS